MPFVTHLTHVFYAAFCHSCTNIQQCFTYLLYRNVCRSLLEKDKLLFSFLLTVKILDGNGDLPYDEWFFLLTGGTATDNDEVNPAPHWLSNSAWGEFCRLNEIATGNYEGIKHSIESNPDDWKAVYVGGVVVELWWCLFIGGGSCFEILLLWIDISFFCFYFVCCCF